MLKDGIAIDGWGRPLLYDTDGTSWTLLSYGRDGLPGGTGMDADARPYDTPQLGHDYYRNPPMPSFRQFLFELPSRGMIYSCYLSGLLATLLTAYFYRPTKMPRTTAVIRIGLIMLASIWFATIIMQLHIPTSH